MRVLLSSSLHSCPRILNPICLFFKASEQQNQINAKVKKYITKEGFKAM